MRRLLLPFVTAALLGAPGVSFAALSDCPQAVRDARGTYASPSQIGMRLKLAADTYGVLPQLLQAVAYAESGWRQFDGNGWPVAAPGPGCRVGVLGVPVDGYSAEDQVRLANDYAFNIDQGGKLLRAAWDESQQTPPPAGAAADERTVIENWYDALCGYRDCADATYPLRIAEVLADPFRNAPGMLPHVRPQWFTTPQSVWDGYVHGMPFQARYTPTQEFVFYDAATGEVAHTAAAPTYDVVLRNAPPLTYPAGLTGPDAVRTECWRCEEWALADGVGVNGRAHVATVAEGAPMTQVSWHPPAYGRYRVFVHVPAVPGRALGPVTYHATGATSAQSKDVVVDQQAKAGSWVGLGEYWMYAEGGVRLAAVPGQPVVADAVRFAAVPDLTVTAHYEAWYGETVWVSAKLGHATAKVSGRAVRFYRRPKGTTAWRYLGTKTTDSQGVARISGTATVNVEYTARFAPPDGGWWSKNGNVKAITVRPVVTIAQSRVDAPLGTPVTISVRVKPAHTGSRIRLYRGNGLDGFVHLASATLSSTGYASWTVKQSYSGGWEYFALLPPHTDHGTGRSKHIVVRWTGS